MNKQEWISWLRLLLAPVLVILLGLLLLVNPDSAAVLISRVLGAVLGLVALGFGVAALLSDRRRAGKVTAAVALAVCGGILGSRPLLLASFAGRIVGLLLVLDGLGDLLNARRRGVRMLMPLLVMAMGAILVLLPMTASRLVFSLCGLVVLVIGMVMLLDRLRRPRLTDKNDIIDAL